MGQPVEVDEAVERSVDASRIALVGHDYGAMYGALLADSDERIAAMVLQAPDALMGNWFAQFWLGSSRVQSARRTLPCSATWTRRPHRAARRPRAVPVGGEGQVFIGQDVRDAYAATSPDADVILYDNADHEFRDAARVDRLAFLEAQLGL